MTRRLFAFLTVCLLLWATTPMRAVVTTLNFEDFESSLRSYWSAYNGASTLTRTNEIASPDGSDYVLKVRTTALGDGTYGTYIYFQPWEAAQGDRFAYERALDVGSWVGGVNRVLEFWAKPSVNYQSPVTTGGLPGYEQMSVGTFTMAASRRGDGSPCPTGQSLNECKGNHGYHGGQFPNTGGRWMKWKLMTPGFRSTTQFYPVTRAVRNTTNSTPFISGEIVNCSPSSTTHTFVNETTHNSQNTIWLLWNAYGVLADAGDTCTGASSGAERTFTSVSQFDSNTYGDQNRTSVMGLWTGFLDRWFNYGGANYEWYADYAATPTATYWDRVSTFYVSTQTVSAGQLPTVDYYDGFVLKDDDRDDNIYLKNLHICYNEAAGKLIFGWGRNEEYRGKTWEVVTSASDIHTLGFDNATAWQTLADDNNDYATMQLNEDFTPPAQTFYVAVRPNDRSPFAQIEYTIPDEEWSPPDPGTPPGRVLRGRRR